VGGKRIGVTSVLGARHETLVKNNPDVEFQSPAAALSFVAPQLAAANCDLQVLLVHGDPREAAELSRQFPQFQVVATAGGADEPPAQIRLIEGSGAAIVETGHKGMYVTVLAFFDHPDPSQRNRYQRVPLDARFAESPQMQAKLTNYQKELQTNGLDGLGLTPVAHPDGEFAGSAACADCHTAAWEVFEKTPHAHATDTLVNLTPARHFDPECLSCHVTGWDPQQYTPYVSGYLGLDSTPHLTQNGCENCHGPAAAHVAAENGEIDATEEELESLRAALRMKIVPNEGNKDGQEFENGTVVKNCMQCHDQDNSPDFDFQEYWPHVRHDGVD
ncbi:MAG TPA: multiheme c-type cytochrome, partial [Lacipirellulaceae bacterium]|nr:multiheme c-type cytochrome [Lacipirellulaceae bacterium]